MGREMRRAQERAERRQKQRDAQPRRSAAPTLSAPSLPHQEGGSMLKPRWTQDIVSELRKVTWPSRRETANLTGVVIIVSLALGVLLGGADLLFGWLVQQTLLR